MVAYGNVRKSKQNNHLNNSHILRDLQFKSIIASSLLTPILKINQMRFSKGCIFKQSYTVFLFLFYFIKKKSSVFTEEWKYF